MTLKNEAEYQVKKKTPGQVLAQYTDRAPVSGAEIPDWVVKILRIAGSVGYTPFCDSFKGKAQPITLQKCVRSEDGRTKLYYINIEVWDIKLEVPHVDDVCVSLSPNVQFYLPEREAVDVKMHGHNNMTLEHIEKFFSDFYEKMGCVPYENNEDSE